MNLRSHTNSQPEPSPPQETISISFTPLEIELLWHKLNISDDDFNNGYNENNVSKHIIKAYRQTIAEIRKIPGATPMLDIWRKVDIAAKENNLDPESYEST